MTNKTIVDLCGVSNPGWSFTPDRIEQLILLDEWIFGQDMNKNQTYKGLQEDLSKEKGRNSGSKIRMFFPLLKDMGLINDYKDEFILNELYTKIGYQFIHLFLRVYINRYKFSESIKSKIDDVFVNYMMIGIKNLIRRKPFYPYMMNNIYEAGKIDKTDFFIITDCDYKNEQDKVRLNLKNRNDDVYNYEIIKNQNAYGYIIPLFLQAGLLVENNDKTLSVSNLYLKYFLEDK